MAPLYFSIICIIFLLSLNLLFQRRSRKFRNLPPGPPIFPIIGNLHQLKLPLHRTFLGLSHKYGQIFSLQLGSRLMIVVSSYSAVQECFSKNDIVLANRPQFLGGKYVGYNYTTIAQSPYGDHWRNLRRIVSLEVLSSHRLNTFLEIRKDEIMRLMQNLAQNSHHEFRKVEFRSRFSEMTFNTIMRMISGKRYYGEDCDVSDVEEAKQFRELIKELVALGGARNPADFFPVLRWFDFDNLEKKLKKLGKRTDAFLQQLIDQHRNGNQNANTMIYHLLNQQQSQPEYYTDEIIKGLVLVMLLAGTDTAAITLEWAMSNLLNHPEILQKVKKELDTYVGSSDRLVDECDMSNLPYLQNIINETLRLYPPSPMLLPHFSSEDCTTGEYSIPKHTIVLVNAWAIHRDPKLWSDPTHFKPERFEKEGEANKLLAFGLGRRACPGVNLAQRTIGLTLALLIQCFEWKRTSEEEIDMTEEGKGITVAPKYPLEAMCKMKQSPAVKNIF